MNIHYHEKFIIVPNNANNVVGLVEIHSSLPLSLSVSPPVMRNSYLSELEITVCLMKVYSHLPPMRNFFLSQMMLSG